MYMGMDMWPETFEQIFIPHISWRLHKKFGFNRPSGLWAKQDWKCWIWVTLDEVQWMTFEIHNGSCTHLVDWIYQLWYHRLNSFWKIHYFTLFPYKSIRDQIWPWRKIGQGQLSVIIWTNLEVLEYPMPQTNFQGHWPFSSREEDFLRFLQYWSCAIDHLNKLAFPYSMEAPHEIWLQSA